MTGIEAAALAGGGAVASAGWSILTLADVDVPSSLSSLVLSVGMSVAGFVVWYMRRTLDRAESREKELLEFMRSELEKAQTLVAERDAEIRDLRDRLEGGRRSD